MTSMKIGSRDTAVLHEGIARREVYEGLCCANAPARRSQFFFENTDLGSKLGRKRQLHTGSTAGGGDWAHPHSGAALREQQVSDWVIFRGLRRITGCRERRSHRKDLICYYRETSSPAHTRSAGSGCKQLVLQRTSSSSQLFPHYYRMAHALQTF